MHTAASLRPRNLHRLVSVGDDDDNNNRALDAPPRTSLHEATTSAVAFSRAVSPIPSKHPSRAASENRSSENRSSENRSSQGPQPGARTSFFSPARWESSWSSIQGVASTLLGSSIQEPSTSPRKKAAPRREYSLAVPGAWGPPGNPDEDAASGSREDRLARAQTERRKRLLAAKDGPGSYKRRSSLDGDSSAPSPTDEDDSAALVYLHRVRPGDTLAGLSIRYNCPQAVLRKANRLWPNDSIQIRNVAYLPVDACGVRGRKAAPPRTAPADPPGDGVHSASDPPTLPSPSIDAPGSLSDDAPWTHDSWVVLPHAREATEIARLPRRTLGYFPPARRKSTACSDPASPRLPAAERVPPPLPSRSASVGQFRSAALKGPGGVGTLSARAPGPAQDRLNELLAQHLPSVAPRMSFESATSTGSTGLENVGGAIEGWVRKMAGKAKEAAAATTPETRAGRGDLIELVENWDLDGREPGGGGAREQEEGEDEEYDDHHDEELMLGERFPVRGRVFEKQGRKGHPR